MFGRCLEGVLKVSRRCLEGVWKGTESCLEVLLNASGRCLEGLCKVFGGCLVFQGSFKVVSRELQGCLKEFSREF